MPYLADRVQETTATTGTGAVTLAGAVAGYQTFSSGFAGVFPCLVTYLLVSGTAWEVGVGTLDATAATLTRDTIRSSSASGALVTLSGTSNVFCTAPAELIDNSTVGHQVAMATGMAMP